MSEVLNLQFSRGILSYKGWVLGQDLKIVEECYGNYILQVWYAEKRGFVAMEADNLEDILEKIDKVTQCI